MIIEQDAVEDFLDHHGVKGMRWGIRNRNGSSSTNVSTQRAKQHKILKTKVNSKKNITQEEQNKKNKRKVAILSASGGAAFLSASGGAALAVISILSKNGTSLVKNLPK